MNAARFWDSRKVYGLGSRFLYSAFEPHVPRVADAPAVKYCGPMRSDKCCQGFGPAAGAFVFHLYLFLHLSLHVREPGRRRNEAVAQKRPYIFIPDEGKDKERPMKEDLK